MVASYWFSVLRNGMISSFSSGMTTDNQQYLGLLIILLPLRFDINLVAKRSYLTQPGLLLLGWFVIHSQSDNHHLRLRDKSLLDDLRRLPEEGFYISTFTWPNSRHKGQPVDCEICHFSFSQNRQSLIKEIFSSTQRQLIEITNFSFSWRDRRGLLVKFINSASWPGLLPPGKNLLPDEPAIQAYSRKLHNACCCLVWLTSMVMTVTSTCASLIIIAAGISRSSYHNGDFHQDS